MIKTENLRRDYGSLTAVQNLNIEIGKGVCYGLIGPNGAGKTTTIRMLATVLEPTDGKAFIGGYDVTENPIEVRQILGYMPDFFSLYDKLKVWEFLDFFGEAYCVPLEIRAKRINWAIEITDLEIKRNELVKGLSRGMRQRLCLAKTLLHNPSVLLLDEPASGLDPKARIDMRKIIRNLTAEGKTILISSHILTELSDFCNAIGIMEKGNMIISGNVDDILKKIKPGRNVQIQVVSGEKHIEAVLKKFSQIKSFSIEDKQVDIVFMGSTEELAELQAELTLAGVRMSSFAERQDNLEDIFMQVAAFDVT